MCSLAYEMVKLGITRHVSPISVRVLVIILTRFIQYIQSYLSVFMDERCTHFSI